ncbi:hypothetical protein JOF53_002212 [Crossiella equi]|uniref:Uncharacterized protein n=1 Tax=Crossiella equi TaxID=130796 RepID=A0ABS5A9S7_9PSEU|nr:hypothetical protein [Crossiella equi]MBP2473340.1 hypothetical protein [Crossiella equi]
MTGIKRDLVRLLDHRQDFLEPGLHPQQLGHLDPEPVPAPEVDVNLSATHRTLPPALTRTHTVAPQRMPTVAIIARASGNIHPANLRIR